MKRGGRGFGPTSSTSSDFHGRGRSSTGGRNGGRGSFRGRGNNGGRGFPAYRGGGISGNMVALPIRGRGPTRGVPRGSLPPRFLVPPTVAPVAGANLLVQTGSKRPASGPPNALNVIANKKPRIEEIGSGDLEARVVALEGANAALQGRVNNLEKDMRHNEVRIFNIPIIPDMNLYDVIYVVLTQGMSITEDVARRLLDNTRKLVRATPSTCIIWGLGSQGDRSLIFGAKSKLNRWNNVFNRDRKVSIMQNFTPEQTVISKKRNEVIECLRNVEDLREVSIRSVDHDKIAVGRDRARVYTDFICDETEEEDQSENMPSPGSSGGLFD